jgi:hypothetical protein
MEMYSEQFLCPEMITVPNQGLGFAARQLMQPGVKLIDTPSVAIFIRR